MKNFIVNIFKTLFFFDFALIITSLIPEFKTENPAISALWQEGVFFLVVGILTFIFLTFVEKRKLKLSEKRGKFKSAILGILSGLIIPVIYCLLLYIIKDLKFNGFNRIPQLWIWIITLFLSALANELLLRGYLFSLYKKCYGFIFATITTTLLFICMNMEIFFKSKKYAITLILFNIILCFMVDKAKTPIISIFTRFIYCVLSVLVLGSNLFVNGYPILADYSIKGKALLTGGKYIVEGSVITLIIASLLTVLMLNKKYNLLQYLSIKKIKGYFGFIKLIPFKKKG